MYIHTHIYIYIYIYRESLCNTFPCPTNPPPTFRHKTRFDSFGTSVSLRYQHLLNAAAKISSTLGDDLRAYDVVGWG